MRKAASVFRRCVSFSAVCSILSSVPILLIPIAKGNEKSGVFGIMIPAAFWLGLIGEQISIWRANGCRKTLEKKRERYPKRIRGRPGVFSPFRTTEGAACDVLFLLGLIVFIVVALLHKGEGALQYVLIFCMVLSFRLHCIFNGINYRYKKFMAKRKVNYDA